MLSDQKQTILVRVDGNTRLGLGHMSRCRSLMHALRSQMSCRFDIVTRDIDMATVLFSELSPSIVPVDSPIDIGSYYIAIVDVPDLDQDQQVTLRTCAKYLVSIDDNGPGVVGQDVLIRPNLLKLSPPYGLAKERYWSGSQFILLHPSFIQYAGRRVEDSSAPPSIVVCFGGGDEVGITHRLVHLLDGIENDFKAEIILGQAFKYPEKIFYETRGKRRFEIARNVSNMAERLWKADLAIISGGTLLYETCALGTPAITICQNTDQSIEADIVHAEGACINCGLYSHVSNHVIRGTVVDLLDNYEKRKIIGAAAARMIEADGSLKTARKLVTLTC